MHDDEEYCRSGDKVVIKTCKKLSNSKYYFVRNVVLPVGRHNLYEKDMSKDEKEAMKYNEELRNKVKVYY